MSHGVFSGVDIETGEEDALLGEFDVGGAKGFAVAVEVLGRRAYRGGAGEVEDVFMAEGQEVTGGEKAAACGVGSDPRGAGVVDGIGRIVVEENDGGFVAAGGVEDGGAVLGAGEGEEKECLDLAFEHALDGGDFEVGQVLGGGGEGFEAAGSGFLFDAPEHVAADRFVEGGQDDADESGASTAQAAGRAIGDVAKAAGFVADAFFGGGADVGGVVEGLGNRHGREAEVAGDVLEGDHARWGGGAQVRASASEISPMKPCGVLVDMSFWRRLSSLRRRARAPTVAR